MRLSLNWLADYIDWESLSSEDLATRLTLTGTEVEGVERLGQGLEQLVVGEVLAFGPHPDAEKLSVAQVNVGNPEPAVIVCGAQNLAVGAKVPVALPGTVMPDGLKIKVAKLRGVRSEGMICSAQELGLEEKSEGILHLPSSFPVGASVTKLLGLMDTILELSITPNRPDCLSMVGMAREVAAIVQKPLRLPATDLSEAAESVPVKVTIEEPELCSLYTGRVITGLKIGPSPQWLQSRLVAAGMRPINNVVDVTNYVLLEMGQPLHAFDLSLLQGGEIRVRTAAPGEKIITLDGQTRSLDPETLVIADAQRPVAIAGIMGGAETEVTGSTGAILLESAHFHPVSIRRSSGRLGLRTEASSRFEKGLDPAGVQPALDRAARLLAELAGGEVLRGVAQDGRPLPAARELGLTLSRLNGVLGISLEPHQVASLLQRLEIGYLGEQDGLLRFSIPSFRGDLTLEADLVEEVARIYGYDQIPSSLPGGGVGRENPDLALFQRVREYLTGQGLMETLSYSFTSKLAIDRMGFPAESPEANPIPICNPLSEEQAVLRTSLTPQLLEVASRNLRRQREEIGLFEVGSVFMADSLPLTSQPQEVSRLGILMTGRAEPLHWDRREREVDFYDLKGVIDGLMVELGLDGVRWEQGSAPGFHPGRTAALSWAGQPLGFVGEVHPRLARELDLPRVYVAELEIAPLSQGTKADVAFSSIARVPSLQRDLAVVVDENVPASEVFGLIEGMGKGILENVFLFDLYRGAQVGEGRKSLAFRLIYRNPAKTLTDQEVNQVQEAIEAGLAKKGWSIRA